MTKIAAIQMCSSVSVDDNLSTAAKLITEAARNQAKLVVLPEVFPMISGPGSNILSIKEKFGEGKIQQFLREQALQHKLWIVGGTIPIAASDPSKVRAACLVINDQGDVVARYDKIHLFDIELSPTESYKESENVEPGNQIIVVDSPLGKLGVAVCYDLRFPELFRSMFNQGAEIFVLPTAFTVPTGEAHWEVLTRSRAIENFCYFVGACQGGTHDTGRKTYGHSLIIDPWGKIMAQQPGTASGVIYADIDHHKQLEIRKRVPVQKHQKIFLDLSKLLLT